MNSAAALPRDCFTSLATCAASNAQSHRLSSIARKCEQHGASLARPCTDRRSSRQCCFDDALNRSQRQLQLFAHDESDSDQMRQRWRAGECEVELKWRCKNASSENQ
jgi:hypothetical protein